MTPAQLMTRLDGLLGSGIRAARAPQRVLLWRDVMRTIVFSHALRDATDWALGSDNDIVNASASGAIDASGGTVYGILIDSIFDVSGEHLVLAVTDLASVTMVATDLQDAGGATGGNDILGANEEGIIWKIPPAADTSNAVFSCLAFPDGMVFATNIDICADGEESTAPTTLDVRAHVVYRSDTEARV